MEKKIEKIERGIRNRAEYKVKKKKKKKKKKDTCLDISVFRFKGTGQLHTGAKTTSSCRCGNLQPPHWWWFSVSAGKANCANGAQREKDAPGETKTATLS